MIKIGCSSDYSFAYLDYFDLKKQKTKYNGPTLPITFYCSGNGRFNGIYKLNLEDPLLRSLYLCEIDQQALVKASIENMNSFLQTITFKDFC
jgi:hypothetical protein